jgi:hypothetical protein
MNRRNSRALAHPSPLPLTLVCTNLHAVQDGHSYTFFPQTGKSEVLQFKGRSLPKRGRLLGSPW